MTDLNAGESRDSLLDAVNMLIAEVRNLNAKLEQYAPRDEVKRTFRHGAWRFLGAAVAIIVVSQLLSTAMISYCFLDANSTVKVACSTIPGYGEAVEQNDIRLNRFNLRLDGVETANKQAEANDRRLSDLEKRISVIEKEEGK